MAKKCPPGKYYCFDDKKCKKIPRGYHIGARGYLARDNRSDNDGEDGNENSNGNGNGGNGSGNGNGGSGGNGGGNGSGGMSEGANPRIPRKKGQPAKSKKHSDLYTDEDPKGTIHGLGFKDVAKAKASVSKIRNSSRSHAHKIQAAVAMEQRAREMGKTSEAAVYRKYINTMKKKTKKMNESLLHLEIPKNNTEFKLGLMFRETLDQDTGMIFEFEKPDRHSFHMKNTSIPLDIAFVREDGTIDSIKKLDPHDPNPVYPDGKVMYAIETNRDWFANNDIEVGDIVERKMTSSEKRKDTMLKKKYDKSDMKKSMQKQYGKEEGKKVYFATIRKQAMEEIDKYNVSEEGLRDWFGKSSGTTKSGRKVKGWVQVGGKYDGKPCARQPGQKSTPKCVSSSKRRSMSDKERDSAARRKRAADPNQPQKSGAAKPTNVSTDPKKKMSENYFNEAKDKKGKGSGTKDACYHKVKSRYSVWPSAYASGALVKCRKVGAANWGNKSKNEGFSPMQVAALEAAGMIDIKEGQKCWKGYEKKGTKMMFGKRYNNCVKKKATKEEVEYTNEGIAFLKREKEKKKSSSEYLKQRDAGKLAKRKMAKKDQEKVNFLEPEETNESKTRLVKNGHTYKVVLTWRGKTYMVQMFVPSVTRPTRLEVEKEVQKLYPDAKVMSFLPRDLEPGEPTVMMGEDVERDEYGDPVDGPKISKKEKKKNLAKNEKDEDHTTTTAEEYVTEDDMKGMSVKSGHKRPTKSGAGMTAKGVAAYRRRNPGSKLKTAVTGKVKKGSKDAKRRKSYCARSAGQMKKFPKAAKDPNSRLRQARRRWKC